MSEVKLISKKFYGLKLKMLLDPTKFSTKEDLVRKIKEITRQVRGDFDSVIDNIWFGKADICMFFENDAGTLVAYSLGGWLEKKKIAIVYSTIVGEKYRKKNLAVILNFILAKQLYSQNKFKWFYCVSRTANPVVTAVMVKYLNAYPSPFREEATSEETKIAKDVAKILSPECLFEEDYFVVRKAFLKDGRLPKEFEHIPFYSEEINSFCSKHLNYEQSQGDAFIMVGKINIFTFLRYFFKEYLAVFSTKYIKNFRSKFWRRYFKVYDTLNQSLSYRSLLKKAVSPIKFNEGKRILDLGCGTANLYKLIKDKNISYVGVDVCSEALVLAKEKVSKTADKAQVKFVECDVRDLCFEDAYFDDVVSNNVLYTLSKDDIKKTLKEIYRVMKPNAGALVITGMRRSFNPLIIYIDSAVKEIKEYGLAGLFHLITTLPSSIKLLYYNFVYIRRKKDQYTFFSRYIIENLFKESQFTIKSIEKVYANQAIRVVAVKE